MNDDSAILPISLMMEKVENKWFFSQNPLISNLTFILMSLSGDDLHYLFNNKLNSKNSSLNRVR